ncbi:MAG: Gfo/Idh/MocA family oxidoreductase [Clostridia bacterium]|nr:Gfo/Idh/MocA family oxidoreductase [Clostridia bacterium]
MRTIRFGILATGDIAARLADTIATVENAEVLAVGSRTLEKAQAFADAHNIERAYGSYEELCADPDVDIIYVATPHSHHYENMLMCIEHNKNILCEKSFTVNADQAKDIAKRAKEKGLFVMEALWVRFHEPTIHAIETAKDGRLGDIRMVTVTFGRVSPDVRGEADRYNRPALAGGAILDLGCYTTHAIEMLFNEEKPVKILTSGTIEDGIDTQSSIILEYPNHKTVTMMLAFRSYMTRHFTVNGSVGRMEAIFPTCMNAKITMLSGECEDIALPQPENNHKAEIVHVVDCLNKGLTNSPICPIESTIQVMEILDECRRQWGLVYPCE